MMEKMTRRMIALIIALALCASLPLTVLAEESTPPETKEDLSLGTPDSSVSTPNSDGTTTTVIVTPVTGSKNDTENSTTTGTLTEVTTVDDAGNTLEESWEASGVITTTEQKDKITTEITAEVPLTSPKEDTAPEEGDAPEEDGLVNHTEVTSDKVDIPIGEEGVTKTDNGDTLIVDSSVPEVSTASGVDGDPYISQEEIGLTPLQPEWTGNEEDAHFYSSPSSPSGDKPEGYDMYFYNYAEDSYFGVAQLDEDQTVCDTGDVIQFVLNEPRTVQDTNEDGTPKVDENGNPVYKQENVKHTVYCVDLSTGAQKGWWYRIESLEDADYYTEEDAAHIRAIVSNGYWGTEPSEEEPSPTGSLDALKKTLKDAGMSVTGLTDAEIDAITEGMASAATQMAIWTYGNQIKGEFQLVASNYNGEEYYEEVNEETDKDKKAIIDKVSGYLASLTMTKEEGGETDVITADKFIKEMSLTVLEEAEVTKEENEAVYNANNDENDDNNVYNVALNFALVVVPDKESDDLVVKVLDGTGKEIAAARIAGDGSTDENYSEIIDHGNGSYTLKDLQLAENSEMEFNLTLEGAQYLEQGVYIYSSEVRGNESSQTFVGMAEGYQEVDLRLAVDLKFDVKEGTIETKREWKASGGYSNLPDDDKDPEKDPDDENKILDKDVPPADAPKTGDTTLILALVSLFSGSGLAVLNRKKEEE